MPSTMTLAQLRTASKQRADMVNSTFVEDSEWDSYINQSIYELYDLLVQKYGDDYYVADPFYVTTDGTNHLFDLPDDFYKVLCVSIQLQGSNNSDPNGWTVLKPFNIQEKDQYILPNIQTFYGVTNMRYRIRGNKLWLNPLPAGGQRVQVLYVPRFEELTSDDETFDGISGWTEYVIVDAAIKALEKEESDTMALENRKAGLKARIESAAENRDAGNPATVTDSRANDVGFPFGYGGWG